MKKPIALEAASGKTLTGYACGNRAIVLFFGDCLVMIDIDHRGDDAYTRVADDATAGDILREFGDDGAVQHGIMSRGEADREHARFIERQEKSARETYERLKARFEPPSE
jgi:hypothetical protein